MAILSISAPPETLYITTPLHDGQLYRSPQKSPIKPIVHNHSQLKCPPLPSLISNQTLYPYEYLKFITMQQLKTLQ